MLDSDEDKQHIAHILHSLFAAPDADESYVKSVASVMRLPGSTNTKPERENAPVQVIECHPDRRYALSSFDWLAVKPQHQNGQISMFSANGNGHLIYCHHVPSSISQAGHTMAGTE